MPARLDSRALGFEEDFVRFLNVKRDVENDVERAVADIVARVRANGDAALIRDCDLTPMLNSVEQITRHLETLPSHAFGVQLDTGMNRLGMDAVVYLDQRSG